MGRALFLMIAALLPALSAGVPLSCQKETPVRHEKPSEFIPVVDKESTVRVLIVGSVQDILLAVNGSYQIAGSSANILEQGQALPKSRVSVDYSGIRMGSKCYNTGELRIKSFLDGAIEINNVQYRGEVSLLRQPDNKLAVIEDMDVEDFVAGVVGSEMPHLWNDEAHCAQAVAVRTYTMYKKKARRSEKYHLDMQDLAYRGMAGETQRLSSIVLKTKGLVMTYNGNIFPAYFHSTCGGHTEDVSHVFEQDSMPPLSGVVCKYCSNSKYSKWKRDIGKSVIERKLREANVAVSNIRSVKTLDPGYGNHGSRVEIVSAGGSKEMSANEFRLLIGPNILCSTAFSAKNSGNNITFSGNGWGHGVGLCQHGAQTMAKKGFKWLDIINYYYPKNEIVRVY
ncbi:MAG: SpoIID/LytB domain-containing protein, partial [Planctomycetes bacterium]|nr:SpoIID/LytB domain-containing protein [Planctomycetota bacterium]